MAKQEYYWFRFKEDFFSNEKILAMEGTSGGYEFESILLKMLALSIRGHGIYEPPLRDNGGIDIYTIARRISHEPQKVEEALRYFEGHGLMEVIRGNECQFHFDIVKNNVGKSSKRADKERLQYHERKELPDTSEEEVKENNQVKIYGRFENVKLTESEYKALHQEFKNALELIEKVSRWKADTQKIVASDYVKIIQFAEKDGIKKVSEEDQHNSVYERCKREAAAGYPPGEKDKNILNEGEIEELEKLAFETWKKEH